MLDGVHGQHHRYVAPIGSSSTRQRNVRGPWAPEMMFGAARGTHDETRGAAVATGPNRGVRCSGQRAFRGGGRARGARAPPPSKDGAPRGRKARGPSPLKWGDHAPKIKYQNKVPHLDHAGLGELERAAPQRGQLHEDHRHGAVLGQPRLRGEGGKGKKKRGARSGPIHA